LVRLTILGAAIVLLHLAYTIAAGATESTADESAFACFSRLIANDGAEGGTSESSSSSALAWGLAGNEHERTRGEGPDDGVTKGLLRDRQFHRCGRAKFVE
jgi:hypothetical protein